MKLMKKIVAVLIITEIFLSTGFRSVTVMAQDSNENDLREGSVNATEIKDEDIPDALEIAGELKDEIKDKYVKRLYDEEQDMNTLLFEKENGERTMYIFEKAVKYEDKNGNIVDKDISFKEIGEDYQNDMLNRYICDNGNNDIKIYMPKNMSDGIDISTDDKSINMSLSNDSKKKVEVIVDEDNVIYEEAFGENTKLKYTPLIDGIKEEIVLEEYTDQTEFKFTLKLDGYKLVTLDDNSLYLENVDNGQIEGIIDSIYMIDNAGKTNFDNYYTFIDLGQGEYEVTAHVNEEFLVDKDTQYPVIIDPPIKINKSNNTNGIYDATLNSTSTTAGSSGSLFVGNRGGENGISRIVMSFPGLNFDDNKVSVVLSAKVSIRDLMCESSSMYINCYALENVYPNWNESNVSWGMLNMQNKPYSSVLDSKVISYSQGLKQNEPHRYEFDITEAVFRWRAGDSSSSANRGIVFVSSYENAVLYKTFGSYNRSTYNPVFEMEYVPYAIDSFSEYEFDNMIREAIEKYPQNTYGQIKFNCLGMALKTIDNIYLSDLGIVKSSDKRDVNKVADAIVNYVRSGKCANLSDAQKVGTGLSTNYQLLSDKQYFVAVRVMKNPAYVLDFHIIAQTNTGTWINKHGEGLIEHLGYINPDNTKQECWYSSSDGYWYDSETVYIIVTKK